MMIEPPPPSSATIARRPTAKAELDFAALRSEGVRLSQRHSGALWTDYNEHDPGITILEQLCFALTEIGYRSQLPVEDLLARNDPSAEPSFYRPSQILPCEPVTAADLRALIIDRVRGLGNIWLDPLDAGAGAPPSGLYDVRAYAAPGLPGLFEPGRDHERLLARVHRVFVRHRPLCEDIGTLAILRPVRTVVSASVTIDPAASPEAALAEMIYRLGVLLAPEPRREPLAALVARGLAASEILDGPLLSNGFIDQDSLTPLRRQIGKAEVEQALFAVEAVLAVRDLHIWTATGGEGPDAPPALADGECFGLDAGLNAPILPIQPFVHGQPVDVDPQEVRRILERHWRDHRRTWRTAGAWRAAFPAPPGRWRDLASYQPVAVHFPPVYGVGDGGLGTAVPPERRAQARQLLGYLALFDRLMAGALDRLAALAGLFAGGVADPGGLERPLVEAVPSLGPLLVDGGPDADAVYGRAAVPGEQEDRLLRFLLGLYGEEGAALRGGSPEAERSAQRRFLDSMVPAGRRRGRGFDTLERRSRRNLSGVETRSRLMLGSGVGRHRLRLAILEHVLLRPRVEPDRRPAQRALAISAVVHDPNRQGSRAWRRQAARIIRANTPAHIALDVHFVGRQDWVRFRRLHRLWRSAIRAGYDQAVDLLSDTLLDRLGGWEKERFDG